jgi:hypothetical protein
MISNVQDPATTLLSKPWRHQCACVSTMNILGAFQATCQVIKAGMASLRTLLSLRLSDFLLGGTLSPPPHTHTHLLSYEQACIGPQTVTGQHVTTRPAAQDRQLPQSDTPRTQDWPHLLAVSYCSNNRRQQARDRHKAGTGKIGRLQPAVNTLPTDNNHYCRLTDRSSHIPPVQDFVTP